MPIVAGGWSIIPEVALRETFYTGSQTPDLTGTERRHSLCAATIR